MVIGTPLVGCQHGLDVLRGKLFAIGLLARNPSTLDFLAAVGRRRAYRAIRARLVELADRLLRHPPQARLLIAVVNVATAADCPLSDTWPAPDRRTGRDPFRPLETSGGVHHPPTQHGDRSAIDIHVEAAFSSMNAALSTAAHRFADAQKWLVALSDPDNGPAAFTPRELTMPAPAAHSLTSVLEVQSPGPPPCG